MDRRRSMRGWMTAITVALLLSLVFLAVDKHLGLHPREFLEAPLEAPEQADRRGASTEIATIELEVDPGLASMESMHPSCDRAALKRLHSQQQQGASLHRLRRPPEPASSVVLQAPVVPEEMAELPLHASSSTVDQLIASLEEVFDSPVQMASVAQVQKDDPRQLFEQGQLIDAKHLAGISPPTSISGRIPHPTQFLKELDRLEQLVDPAEGTLTDRALPGFFTSTVLSAPLASREATAILAWSRQAREILNRVVSIHGLEHAASREDIQELTILAAQASELADGLENYEVAVHLHRAGYALQRRIMLWQAVLECLRSVRDGKLARIERQQVRSKLDQAIGSVESLLNRTGDERAWRQYLFIDELKAWLASGSVSPSTGCSVPLRTLSRIRWDRLQASQQNFLTEPEFEELAGLLTACGRAPVDYRQLLANVEHFEQNPLSPVAGPLASSVQILRHSDQESQLRLANVLNTHYRNANLRLTVSEALINRFLPNGEYEIRPVRRTILGADTSGDSAIRTELNVRLLPDRSGWNLDLGVSGDVVSRTRSRKGPAIFDNSSTATINSHRYIRLDTSGYRVSSQPTDVNSQDYLRGFRTEFDSLPIIGDFVRLIVREQFDQKRGLAQRITRRLIASETDHELDRRIEEGLVQAEREFSERLIGPLARLNLNPMVVAMSTNEDRLSVRYRVANELQMAAHTPRPRAPGDNLLSMQIHESTINNAIERIGLSGRTWMLPDLYERLAEVFQRTDWTLPNDVPEDISIRFADERPVMVELRDGKLRLTLRVAELHQPGRLHIERFVVSTDYIPVADGLNAELIRDGVVEIVSRHDRLALRVIFAKVFLSRPEIPLIAESWRNDPRAEGLAVSQMDIRDGWLAIAISDESSPFATQVARRSQEVKLH